MKLGVKNCETLTHARHRWRVEEGPPVHFLTQTHPLHSLHLLHQVHPLSSPASRSSLHLLHSLRSLPHVHRPTASDPPLDSPSSRGAPLGVTPPAPLPAPQVHQVVRPMPITLLPELVRLHDRPTGVECVRRGKLGKLAKVVKRVKLRRRKWSRWSPTRSGGRWPRWIRGSASAGR